HLPRDLAARMQIVSGMGIPDCPTGSNHTLVPAARKEPLKPCGIFARKAQEHLLMAAPGPIVHESSFFTPAGYRIAGAKPHCSLIQARLNQTCAFPWA